jgi:excinuclease UvrABC nuclease subunit
VRAELRVAYSELEALLVEAELVGKLQPAFNRQMRSPRRYCYLVRNDSVLDPFSVSSQACSWKPCFGPYRSRQQVVRVVEAVFHLTRLNVGNGRLLDTCVGLLSGSDDSLLLELDRQIEDTSRAAEDEPRGHVLRRSAKALRAAYERGALLRRAETLLNTPLILPGPGDSRTVVFVSRQGLHLTRVRPTVESASAFLHQYQDTIPGAERQQARRLPKSIADCLCVAAQQLRRKPDAFRSIPADRLPQLSPRQLLSLMAG